MMSCVNIVTYSIVVNGKQCGKICPKRGLRQGDLLSLYLFLFCAEGLSGLIKKAVSKGTIQEVAVARRGPKISHLFFADDSLIFCKANRRDCNKVLDILNVYEQASR